LKEELVKAVSRLADVIEKPDEAKKWQIVALKALSQLSSLQKFVKSSIADLEKLDVNDELTEHYEGKLLAYFNVAEKMRWNFSNQR